MEDCSLKISDQELEKELERIPARVQTGIAWLDKLPEVVAAELLDGYDLRIWRQYINPDSLCMYNDCHCIFGQLTGAYSNVTVDHTLNVRRGFVAPKRIDVSFCEWTTYYDTLSDEWEKRITM